MGVHNCIDSLKMYNSTEQTEGPVPSLLFPRETTLAAGICAASFSVLGILGNAVTILALSKDPKLNSKSTTLFVINLSVLELIFSALCLPLEATTYLSNFQWLDGNLVCRLTSYLNYSIKCTSLLSLVSITVNRYVLTVHHPHYSRFFSRAKSLALILLIWLFCFGTMLLPLLEIWGRFGKAGQMCKLVKNDYGSSPSTAIHIFFFILPELSIIYCYARIYFVHKTRRNVFGAVVSMRNSLQPRRASLKAEDLQLTKMIFLIVACFQICYIPKAAVAVFSLDKLWPTSRIIGYILIWAPSWINTLVYVLTNKQYREAYQRLFGLQSKNPFPDLY